LSSIRTLASIVVIAAISGCEFGTTPPVSSTTCDPMPQCNGDAGPPDPLYTCGGPWDMYDCLILEEAKAANEPDPMIFKAQVSLESGFNVFAISPDSPCGPHMGWTDAESKSFGLMQLTPACGWLQAALNLDGHPNMTKDMASDQWATSVFNPLLNIAEGVRAIQVGRANVTRRFPGCTEVEYTRMALAAFNQGSNSVTGCNAMNAAALTYVTNVLVRYHDLARGAGWPNPY
jgi:Transglycosylase SLT domain